MLSVVVNVLLKVSQYINITDAMEKRKLTIDFSV